MTDLSIPPQRGDRPSILIESLEARRLFTHAIAEDGPHVTGETFIGPVTAMTAVVLQFNQHLDPTTANNLAAYHIGRIFSSDSSGGGFDPIGFLTVHKGAKGSSTGPTGTNRPQEILHPDTTLGSAVYDDATETVTITSAHPFRANVFLRFVRVAGTGPNTVRNTDGIALDGAGTNHPGTQDNIRYRFRRTDSFTYTDAQKNKVTLKLFGPGTMMLYIPRHGDPSPIVFLYQTDPSASILTGTIKPGKGSDGTTTLQELTGTSAAQIQLSSSFEMTYTQP